MKTPNQPDQRYDVRGDCQKVSEQAERVLIDPEAIARWAAEVDPGAIRPAPRPPELCVTGTPAELARWVLLLDCLNFCFWTTDEVPWTIEHAGRSWRRYSALVAALHRAVSRDRGWLEPARWASATSREVEDLFAGRGRIPLLAERVGILNETGKVAIERFDGEPIHLVESARFDAAAIAAHVADAFNSFRDVHLYKGRPVAILKRAQIFAADLAHAWADLGGPGVVGLASLTAFADYRIPQMLRHLGVLILDRDFEARIEARQRIEPSSREEIELRACSIWAVEEMVRALQAQRGVSIRSWLLDEYLWDRSHDPQVRLEHHRTVTFYY